MMSGDSASADKLMPLFRERGFWAQLATGLTISDDCGFEELVPWPAPAQEPNALRAGLDRTGYLQLPHVVEPDLSARLAAAIAHLASLGIPPVFSLVYDQFWEPAFRLRNIIALAFGADCAILPAFWVWHVDPAKSESGWRPHREIGHEALFADRRPKALSAWIALSDATPLNGCMHVVPADRDPTYGTAEDGRHGTVMSEGRALPAAAGDVLIWTQALLHWGGQSQPGASAARISMSFEYIHGGVEPYDRPLVEPAAIRPFAARLRLIGQQILRYRHMYGLPRQLEELARGL
jgi:hypothetical protein